MEPKTRLTLADLPSHTPTPDELYNELSISTGWNYLTKNPTLKTQYLQRDRTLPCIMYLAALRVSEAIPLIKDQFTPPIHDKVRGDFITIKDVVLAKRREGKRETNNIDIPLTGERAKFTQLITEYLDTLEPHQRLYPWSLRKIRYPCKGLNASYLNREGKEIQRYQVHTMGCTRAWQIVKALMPDITEHWLRAYGEDFFYVLSGKDVIATAHKFKVDPRTLANWYLSRRHMEVPVR
jgi:hypothetical protein